MTEASTSSAGDRGTRWIIPALVVVGVMHLLTLAQNHSEAEDSVHYIMDVTNSENLFHPNHLLFNPINWLHYKLWVALGYSGDATLPMQLLSVTASLTSVYLAHRIALRIGASPLMALAAAGWTAFSYGFWVYSLEADTYAVPLPFVLMSVLLLCSLGAADLRDLGRAGAIRLAALGALSAIAALLHQQYLFMLPIVCLTLVLVWRRTPGHSQLSLITTCGIYSVVAVSLIAISYILVGALALGHQSIFETVAWARGHASNGMWTNFSPMSFVMMLVGIGRAIFGFNFVFAWPAAARVMAQAFPQNSLVEEQYLAEHFIGTAGFWLTVAVLLAAFAAIAWLAFTFVRGVRKCGVMSTGSPRWIFTRFAIIYIAIYAVLILIWEPANPEFWIALTPILSILFASSLGDGQRTVAPAFVLVIALFTANMVGGVWPYSRADSDYWNIENAGFKAVARKGDMIVTECGYVCRGNISFTTGADPINASSDDVAAVETALAADKRRVFVSSWAFDPPPGAGESKSTGTGRVRALLQSMRDRMIEVGRTGDQVIWQVAKSE